MPSLRCLAAWLSAAMPLILAHAAAADVRTTVLLRTGDPALAVGPDITWQSFLTTLSDPVLTADGQVAFSGIVAGPGVTTDNATVLVAGPLNGPYRLIARGGRPASGATPGVNFNQPVLPYITESGRILFYSTLTGPGITTANDSGLWLENQTPGGDPVPVILEGGPAPALTGLTIASFDVRQVRIQPRFSYIALVATLSGPGITTANDSVLYQSLPGSPAVLTVLAREGDLIPNHGGLAYGNFGIPCYAGGPASAELVVRCSLTGPGVTAATDGAFLLFPVASSGFIVIREGDPIPGFSPGIYNQLLSPYALPTGDIGYFSTISGLPAANGGHFIGPRLGFIAGNPRIVSLRGDPAPGLPAGSTIQTATINAFDVASDGRAVYTANCVGPGVTTNNDQAVFSEARTGIGAAALVAREGDPAPGLAPTVTFSGFGGLFASSAINVRHQLALFHTARSPANDPLTDVGLWVADAAGTTHLIAHRTASFALSPTDIRPVASVGYRVIASPQLAERPWFLDDGRLITSLAFTDNTAALLLVHIDPPPLCRADFNGDGSDTLQDLFDFLFAWFARDARADVNGVDGVSLQDLFDFLSFWFQGC